MGRGWGRRAAIRAAALTGAAAFALSGCTGQGDTVDPGGAASPAAPGQAGPAAGPLGNADGTAPGLAALTADADRAQARAVIDQLRTAGRGAKTGYSRDEYGPAWTDKVDGVPLSRNGCGTRDDILKRDGTAVAFKSGSKCVVNTMTLADPYTGKEIAFTKSEATAVQIDHVVALSASWQMGAARWSEDKRTQLANDPLNLLAVDGPTNNGKGDSTPASWLPPNKPIRCAYAVRYAQVSLKYDLPVTDADKAAMLQQCA
ncbi:HNH endonuclease family protein [Yinghuangia soli]|uniref:HNH endonuclease family protein n=1 Tax=Yinghuangia soli TaxID=2908204 RepID=A0AA41Q9K0_9ACTN|nr:HNH endonuclease family protein [Yinghuangia soli]MCF2532707.1 HNH endonuclease family protein [Yinghuangia soli]